MKPKLVLMLNYARSGGTLLIKFLNSNKKINVFSEINHIHSINSKGSLSNIESALFSQAREWFNIEPSGKNFIEILLSIVDINNERGVCTIIRDWSFVQFANNEINNFSPVKKLQFLEILNAHFEISVFAFVRNGIDVFLSRKNVAISDFESSYTSYLDQIIKKKIKYFRYEDLIDNQSKFLLDLSNFINVENNYDVRTSLILVQLAIFNLESCQEDKELKNKISTKEIVFEKKILEINSAEMLMKYNKIFGYHPNYWNGKVQNIFQKLFDDIQKFSINYFQNCLGKGSLLFNFYL